MAQVMNTTNGPILCSRVNAGSAECGDLLVSEHGHRIFRIKDVRRRDEHVVVNVVVAGTGERFRLPLLINDPVWRAVGARAGGHR